MTETNNSSNGIIVEELSKVHNLNSRFLRIASMFLDHFIMCFILVPPIILITIIGEQSNLLINEKALVLLFFCLILIYLNKDFLKAKSPAKRILGYQIIDRKSKKQASELQCFIRNLTIFIAWPLEVLIGLINPERRIGDFLANTSVIKSEKENLKTLWSDFKNVKFKLMYIGILLISVVYFYGLSLLLPGVE